MNAVSTVKEESQKDLLKPIFIDFGKHSRKNIKKVSQGRGGKLMDKIEDAVAQLRAEGTMQPKAQPVIIIVRQRRRTSRGLPGLLG